MSIYSVGVAFAMFPSRSLSKCLFLNYVVFAVLLVPIGGCALLYRDLEEPSVRLVGITPQQIGLGGIKLLCHLRIDNPNDVSIPIKGGQFGLEVEETRVANGALIDGFSVPAGGSEIVDVLVEVDSGRSLALGLRLLNAGARELNYALTGHVDVAIAILGRVSINETGSVRLTSEPTSSDVRGPAI